MMFDWPLTHVKYIINSILLRASKGKVLPYLLPSTGPRADPGVQAVSLQVTISHPPTVGCHYFPPGPCFTLVSVYHIVPPLTEVTDNELQLTTHRSTLKGWKAELAWLVDLQRTVYPHKWLPVSYRYSAGHGKFAGQSHAANCVTVRISMWENLQGAILMATKPSRKRWLMLSGGGDVMCDICWLCT